MENEVYLPIVIKPPGPSQFIIGISMLIITGTLIAILVFIILTSETKLITPLDKNQSFQSTPAGPLVSQSFSDKYLKNGFGSYLTAQGTDLIATVGPTTRWSFDGLYLSVGTDFVKIENEIPILAKLPGRRADKSDFIFIYQNDSFIFSQAITFENLTCLMIENNSIKLGTVNSINGVPTEMIFITED